MKKQRVLALFLALVMVMGLLPMGALAARGGEEPVELPAPAAEEAAERPAAATDSLAELPVPGEAAALSDADAAGSVAGKAYSEDPNAYEIYPVPHSVVYPDTHTSFTMTDAVHVVADAGVDEYTIAFLDEILERFARTKTTGAQEDAGVTNIVLRIDAAMVENSGTDGEGHYDPYTLTADSTQNANGVITITGKDTDCVYYGLATLQMMFTSFHGERFLDVTIEDWSNVALRGFIEGFYGEFTYPARESQMRSIRDVKGNIYVFASKDDPYHGGNKWDQAYEGEELENIRHLVQVGKELKVEYTWSLHMGQTQILGRSGATITDEFYTSQLDKVKAKFQSLYDVGVRSFHILNDDTNSGSNERRVQFLNDINAWLKEKRDCKPLVYCCEHYCKSWGNQANREAELTSLQGLDPDIYLYWTGDAVNAPMTQESLQYPFDFSRHQILTWLNYPCSEHDKAGIYLGNLAHYVSTADGLKHQGGFLSNPVNYPEANKVAYFQLLSWCWNRDDYAANYLDEVWKNCFKYLEPEVAGAYYTIAQNTSNCPDSGRYPEGFPESEHLTERLAAVQEAVLAGNALSVQEEAQALKDEFSKIIAAVAAFREGCQNDDLKAELEPHLKSLENVAAAALASIDAANALARGDNDTAWGLFSQGAVALGKWDANPPSNTQNGYPGKRAKAGSKRLQPFANAMLSYVREAMAQIFNPGGGLTGEMVPMVRTGGTDRPVNDNARKIMDGAPTSYASYEHDQSVGDYIGVDLGEVKLVSAIDILQGMNDTHHDYFHKAALECSTDGEHWTELVTKVNSHHIAVDGLNVAARYVRLRLLEVGYRGPNGQHNQGENYYTYLREFTVTTKSIDTLYTNVDGCAASVAEDGGTYTLSVPSLTLAAGEYVGIRFPALTAIRALATAGSLPAGGVKLQYSVSGETWTDGTPTQATLMGYARLYNGGSADAVLSNVTLTATAPVRTQLSFVSSNPAAVGSGGSGSWDNVVDGNRSTKVYVGSRQAYGQYAIFDLGGRQPVEDVTLVVPEGDESIGINALDIPHNLDFFVGDSSDPNGAWTKIGQLRSANLAGADTPPANNTDISDPSYAPYPPYRIFTVDGEGAMGRYLKVALADVVSFRYYYINELEVNKTVDFGEIPTAVSATSGDAADAVDGDLLTFFAPDAGEAGHWEKLLSAPTAFTSVTVLRGAAGATAKVQVLKGSTWTDVGPLTNTATTLSLADQDQVTGIRVAWTAGDVPAIAEVVTAGGSIPTGETPTLLPNIYEQPAQPQAVTVPNGTAVENIPLPDRVEVATSGGVTAQVGVTWTCANYAPATAGTYTFTGEFDLTNALLTNPGGFSLTAAVTVRAASTGEPTTGSLLPETPELNGNVWASGRELVDARTNQDPTKAIDGNVDTWWSSNKMKHKGNSARYETIPDAVSWITVALGANVTNISQVYLKFNAKVWPLEYYIQAGDSTLSYAEYTTPTIDTAQSNTTTDISDVTYASGYAETMHALDAAGWTTLYHGTNTEGGTTNPEFTFGEGGTAFDAAAPAGTRYLRIYFTQINPQALGGTGIGLRELTVTGTRSADASDPDITVIAPASASGVRGDSWDALNVPTHVTATLADGSSIRLPVTWDNTGYDATVGIHTFSGTLTLPSGVTNTNNVTPQLTVTLSEPPAVTGCTVTPRRVTAAHRTAFDDLELPATAVVQFSNGDTRTLAVTWTAASYNADTVGDQTIEGTVALPWDNATHAVTISVYLAPVLATEVTVAPKTLTLYANEGHADHTAALTATVGGADASDKTVTWTSSDIHVAAVTAGADNTATVTAMGPGTATVYAIAHDGSRISDSCAVTVKWVLEGSVTVSGGPRVGSILSADLNSFVQDAKKSIGIQWQRKAKDAAEFTNVSGATQKEYTVPAEAANIGAQYRVVITGQGLYEGSSQSEPKTMTALAGPALKAVPTATKVSAPGASDGAITGLFKGRAYEYQKVAEGTAAPSAPSDSAWIPFKDTTGDETGSTATYGTASIADLTAGTYVVRRAADALHEAGPYRTVTVDVKGAENYAVTNPNDFDGNIVQVGRTSIPERDTVTLTVTPKEGFELVPGSLKATEDGDPTKVYVAVPKEGTTDKYTFTMPSADVTISAQFRRKTYNITHGLTHITCDMAQHDHTAAHGERFTITLTPEAGYEMKPDTITVTLTGTDTRFTDYTYLPAADPAKRVLTFEHGVTGHITISGEATLKEYIIDHQLTDLTCDVGDEDHHKVAHGAALTVTITPRAGYVLPAAKEDIRITMGGADFTDFTYTVADGHGTIAIAAGKITGELVVTAAATVPLTSVAVRGMARVGERLSADVLPSTAKFTCVWTLTDPEGGDDQTVTGPTLLIPADALGKTIHLTVTGTEGFSGTLTADPAGPVTAAIADKTALRAAYDSGVAVDRGNYTAATWDAFQDALAAAEGVLDNGDATQEQVDEALTALNQARSGLKTPSRPTTSTQTPTPTVKTQVTEDGTKVTTVTGLDGAVTITATDANGEELAKVEIPATIPEPETKFEDLDTVPWAEEAVNNVAALELVKGTGGNKYDPVAPMTRGSLATVLHRLSQGKSDYQNTFKDVAAGKYYTEGVAWAAKANVVKGISEDVFAPDDIITREQLAVMLARYAKLIGMDTKADATKVASFADGDATGSWAVDGVAWCVQNGILKGKGGNALDPTAEVSRAEVAVMLDRFIALIK